MCLCVCVCGCLCVCVILNICVRCCYGVFTFAVVLGPRDDGRTATCDASRCIAMHRESTCPETSQANTGTILDNINLRPIGNSKYRMLCTGRHGK